MCSLHLTHPSAHTPGAVGSRRCGVRGAVGGVRCLAQGSHLSRGQFLPEPRFEPTTSGYKCDALSIRATTAPLAISTSIFSSHKSLIHQVFTYEREREKERKREMLCIYELPP